MAQVCNLEVLTEQERQEVFTATPVDEVWGVGRRISKQLSDGGIRTVWDLMQLDTATVRRGWSVVLERTVRELHGIGCVDLDHSPAPKKEIACTRSFGKAVLDEHALAQAVTEFATRACEKLRKQGSLCAEVLVFVRTSPFRSDPQYSRSTTVPLRRPTADTAAIVNSALAALHSIYRPGYRYAKAGVMLLDLQSHEHVQYELDLEDEASVEDRGRLMSALDGLNHRFGKGTVHLASAGTVGEKRSWSMKQERRTPGYTTRWSDIPVARA